MNEHVTAPIVVMGVQGSGKSTIGTLLAHSLGRTFLDGDDFHSVHAKSKMAGGMPLDDHDREPWLTAIAQRLKENSDNGEHSIAACSALKVQYRDLMRATEPNLIFVHLEGNKSLLGQRIQTRSHEYMPATLLDSQFEVLEPLAAHELGFTVNVDAQPTEVVKHIIAQLAQSPKGAKP